MRDHEIDDLMWRSVTDGMRLATSRGHVCYVAYDGSSLVCACICLEHCSNLGNVATNLNTAIQLRTLRGLFTCRQACVRNSSAVPPVIVVDCLVLAGFKSCGTG